MLVFGGIGAASIYGDLHSCRLADPVTYYTSGGWHTLNAQEGQQRQRRRRQIVWEEVELGGGEVPEARYVLVSVVGGLVDWLWHEGMIFYSISL